MADEYMGREMKNKDDIRMMNVSLKDNTCLNMYPQANNLSMKFLCLSKSVLCSE